MFCLENIRGNFLIVEVVFFFFEKRYDVDRNGRVVVDCRISGDKGIVFKFRKRLVGFLCWFKS